MLNEADQRVFLIQILNEMFNGLRLEDFGEALGWSEDEAKSMWLQLKRGKDITTFSSREVSSLRRAIALTMHELEDGCHEFQTRTGFELEDAAEMLKLLESNSDGV